MRIIKPASERVLTREAVALRDVTTPEWKAVPVLSVPLPAPIDRWDMLPWGKIERMLLQGQAVSIAVTESEIRKACATCDSRLSIEEYMRFWADGRLWIMHMAYSPFDSWAVERIEDGNHRLEDALRRQAGEPPVIVDPMYLEELREQLSEGHSPLEPGPVNAREKGRIEAETRQADVEDDADADDAREQELERVGKRVRAFGRATTAVDKCASALADLRLVAPQSEEALAYLRAATDALGGLCNWLFREPEQTSAAADGDDHHCPDDELPPREGESEEDEADDEADAGYNWERIPAEPDAEEPADADLLAIVGKDGALSKTMAAVEAIRAAAADLRSVTPGNEEALGYLRMASDAVGGLAGMAMRGRHASRKDKHDELPPREAVAASTCCRKGGAL